MTVTPLRQDKPADAAGCAVCLLCRSRDLDSGFYDEACAARIRQAAALVGRAGISERRMTKAMELIWAGRATPALRAGLFRVVSSDGSATYLTGTASCTCPATVTCYHMIAVVILSVVTLAWGPPG